ncbi:MAG: HAMP domain-containing sensor histidine kinase, partial [Anaerolinea sp.]
MQDALDQAGEGLPRVVALNNWSWEGWCYNPELAWQRANEARQLAYALVAEGQDVWSALGDSLLCIAHLLMRMNRVHEITSEIADAAMMFSHASNASGMLRCHWLQALRHAYYNEEQQALSLLQSLLQEPAIAQHPLVLGRAQMLLGTLLARMGEGHTAIRYLEAASNTFQAAEHPLLRGQTLASWVVALLAHNHPMDVIQLAHSALPIQREQMDWYSQSRTIRCLIRAYLRLGDVANARRYLDGFAMISQYIQSILSPHYGLMLQAEVEYYSGNIQQADAYMSSAMLMLSRLRNPYEIIELRETAAMIYQAQENYEWALMHMYEVRLLQDKLLKEARQHYARSAHMPHMIDIFNRTMEQQQNETAELKARLDELSRLLDMFSEVSSNLNVGYVTSLALDAAMRLANADAGFFAISDEGTWRIQSVLGAYSSLDFEVSQTLQPAFESRRVVVLAAGQLDMDGLPVYPASKVRILIPLHIGDRLVGLLVVETANPQRFNNNVYELMETIQSFVAIALDNALLYERLAEQNHELATSLARVTRLENFKTDMIRLASHDLKQPLTILRLYLSMIQHTTAHHLTDTQVSYFGAMQNAISMMDRLITDILSLERIEEIALNPPNTIFDLLEICREQVQLVQVQAADRQQTLTFITDLPQALVCGDQSQLREAISNLIGNALKYTPAGGVIQARLYT